MEKIWDKVLNKIRVWEKFMIFLELIKKLAFQSLPPKLPKMSMKSRFKTPQNLAYFLHICPFYLHS